MNFDDYVKAVHTMDMVDQGLALPAEELSISIVPEKEQLMDFGNWSWPPKTTPTIEKSSTTISTCILDHEMMDQDRQPVTNETTNVDDIHHETADLDNQSATKIFDYNQMEDIQSSSDRMSTCNSMSEYSSPESSLSSTTTISNPTLTTTEASAFIRPQIHCQITGKIRLRLAIDDDPKGHRAVLRRKWERLCALPASERDVPGGWIEGDSDLDFSDYEETRAKREGKEKRIVQLAERALRKERLKQLVRSRRMKNAGS